MDAQLTGRVALDGGLEAWIARGELRGHTTLCLWNAELTDRGAGALASTEDAGLLDYVDLSWNHVGAIGAGRLVASPQLARMTRLRLYHNEVGVRGASAIASDGGRLATLNLCGNALGDAGVTALADGSLDALHELALGWNDLGAGAVRAIVGGPWRSLAMLNIRANRLGPAEAAVLGSGALPALRWLGLDDNPLGNAGVATLLGGPGAGKLEWLNLGGTEIDDGVVVHFRGNTALRELRVHDNELSERAVAELRAMLPGCEVRA